MCARPLSPTPPLNTHHSYEHFPLPQEINEDGLLVLKSTGWAKFSVQYPDVPKYSVTGANSQIVTVSLAENESVQTEPGTMLYKSGDVSTSTECGGCFNRCCSGEVSESEDYGERSARFFSWF